MMMIYKKTSNNFKSFLIILLFVFNKNQSVNYLKNSRFDTILVNDIEKHE